MVPTIELFRVAESEGIEVEYLTLPPGFLGMYCCDADCRPHIGLDKSLNKNRILHRCVFSHELGHHFETAGATILAASTTTTTMYFVAKSERLANDWAIDFLVPPTRFLRMVAQGYRLDELVEYFDVLPEFIMRRARRIYRAGLKAPELKKLLYEEPPRGGLRAI